MSIQAWASSINQKDLGILILLSLCGLNQLTFLTFVKSWSYSFGVPIGEFLNVHAFACVLHPCSNNVNRLSSELNGKVKILLMNMSAIRNERRDQLL